MTSLFRPSSETAKAVVSKVMLWGPSGSGKTHFMMGAPGLALLDVETRARNFAIRDEFSFLHAECPDIADFAAAVKEVRRGGITCDTIGVDSGSALYLKLVEHHTKETDSGAYVTDWVVVNRRFLAALNFLFSVVNRNVIFTMHSAPKLIRQGRDFRNAGEHLVGDERLRFGFDYVIRIEPDGDPAVKPARFVFEKTASPHIREGQAIAGLTWPKFRALASGKSVKAPTAALAPTAVTPAETPPPATARTAARFVPGNGAPAPNDDADPIRPEQHALIVETAARQHLQNSQLADLVKAVSQRTPAIGGLSVAEANKVLTALARRETAGAR